ncbi:MAG: GNAT family N-acetyltransferase [Methylobacteriaceae bacterium]|nr:GNAT family N-acetyltransferase [Methylobacteriaceae bacterium]
MFPDLTRDDVFRLETRRLWLRWPRQADLSALVQLAGDKAVAEMTAQLPHPYGPEHAVDFVAHARRQNGAGCALTMAITPRSRPADLIGVVGIRASEGGRPTLGYWVGAPFWDGGFATEAARGLIDAFFAYTENDELMASARVVNPGSRRVLEKCGFTHAGSGLEAFPARGGVFPVDHFRLDRRKWASFKAWGTADYIPRPREPDVAQLCGA